jgi:dihydrofolate reductase
MDGVRTSRCWTVTSSRRLQSLRQELDAEIVVNRSAQPVQTLIENNLVYELRLMIYPVVLGAGTRDFGRRCGTSPRTPSATAS